MAEISEDRVREIIREEVAEAMKAATPILLALALRLFEASLPRSLNDYRNRSM